MGSFGDSPLGDLPLGGESGVGADTLPKFRVIKEIPRQDFFEIQVTYETDNTDERWQILSHGANAVISNNMPVSIKQ